MSAAGRPVSASRHREQTPVGTACRARKREKATGTCVRRGQRVPPQPPRAAPMPSLPQPPLPLAGPAQGLENAWCSLFGALRRSRCGSAAVRAAALPLASPPRCSNMGRVSAGLRQGRRISPWLARVSDTHKGEFKTRRIHTRQMGPCACAAVGGFSRTRQRHAGRKASLPGTASASDSLHPAPVSRPRSAPTCIPPSELG